MRSDSYFIINSVFGGYMKIVLMENEQELWKIKARKEAYLIFPINIIAAIINSTYLCA